MLFVQLFLSEFTQILVRIDFVTIALVIPAGEMMRLVVLVCSLYSCSISIRLPHRCAVKTNPLARFPQ